MTRSGPIYTCQYQCYYSATQRKPALLHKVNKSEGCNSGGGSETNKLQAVQRARRIGQQAERRSFCGSVQKRYAGTLFEVVCMFSPFSPHKAVFLYVVAQYYTF